MSPERIVEAKWGNAYSTGVPVTIGIQANDRGGLLRDITTIIANEKINVLGVRSRSNVYEQVAYIDVDMEIYNIGDLKKVLGKLNRLGDVLSAKRL
jgi:GTP pyrophosphokinase